MALAIDAAIGGAASNSYQSFEAAVAYFESRLNSDAWDNAGEANQKKALITITNRLEQIRNWDGERTSLTQRLSHPRIGLEVDGVSIDSNTIAECLGIAQFEGALWLLTEDGDVAAVDALSRFSAITIPSLSLTIRDDVSTAKDSLPPVVLRLIAQLRCAESVSFERG